MSMDKDIKDAIEMLNEWIFNKLMGAWTR